MQQCCTSVFPCCCGKKVDESSGSESEVDEFRNFQAKKSESEVDEFKNFEAKMEGGKNLDFLDDGAIGDYGSFSVDTKNENTKNDGIKMIAIGDRADKITDNIEVGRDEFQSAREQLSAAEPFPSTRRRLSAAEAQEVEEDGYESGGEDQFNVGEEGKAEVDDISPQLCQEKVPQIHSISDPPETKIPPSVSNRAAIGQKVADWVDSVSKPASRPPDDSLEVSRQSRAVIDQYTDQKVEVDKENATVVGNWVEGESEISANKKGNATNSDENGMHGIMKNGVTGNQIVDGKWRLSSESRPVSEKTRPGTPSGRMSPGIGGEQNYGEQITAPFVTGQYVKKSLKSPIEVQRKESSGSIALGSQKNLEAGQETASQTQSKQGLQTDRASNSPVAYQNPSTVPGTSVRTYSQVSSSQTKIDGERRSRHHQVHSVFKKKNHNTFSKGPRGSIRGTSLSPSISPARVPKNIHPVSPPSRVIPENIQAASMSPLSRPGNIHIQAVSVGPENTHPSPNTAAGLKSPRMISSPLSKTRNDEPQKTSPQIVGRSVQPSPQFVGRSGQPSPQFVGRSGQPSPQFVGRSGQPSPQFVGSTGNSLIPPPINNAPVSVEPMKSSMKVGGGMRADEKPRREHVEKADKSPERSAQLESSSLKASNMTEDLSEVDLTIRSEGRSDYLKMLSKSDSSKMVIGSLSDSSKTTMMGSPKYSHSKGRVVRNGNDIPESVESFLKKSKSSRPRHTHQQAVEKLGLDSNGYAKRNDLKERLSARLLMNKNTVSNVGLNNQENQQNAVIKGNADNMESPGSKQPPHLHSPGKQGILSRSALPISAGGSHKFHFYSSLELASVETLDVQQGNGALLENSIVDSSVLENYCLTDLVDGSVGGECKSTRPENMLYAHADVLDNILQSGANNVLLDAGGENEKISQELQIADDIPHESHQLSPVSGDDCYHNTMQEVFENHDALNEFLLMQSEQQQEVTLLASNSELSNSIGNTALSNELSRTLDGVFNIALDQKRADSILNRNIPKSSTIAATKENSKPAILDENFYKNECRIDDEQFNGDENRSDEDNDLLVLGDLGFNSKRTTGIVSEKKTSENDYQNKSGTSPGSKLHFESLDDGSRNLQSLNNTTTSVETTLVQPDLLLTTENLVEDHYSSKKIRQTSTPQSLHFQLSASSLQLQTSTRSMNRGTRSPPNKSTRSPHNRSTLSLPNRSLNQSLASNIVLHSQSLALNTTVQSNTVLQSLQGSRNSHRVGSQNRSVGGYSDQLDTTREEHQLFSKNQQNFPREDVCLQTFHDNIVEEDRQWQEHMQNVGFEQNVGFVQNYEEHRGEHVELDELERSTIQSTQEDQYRELVRYHRNTASSSCSLSPSPGVPSYLNQSSEGIGGPDTKNGVVDPKGIIDTGSESSRTPLVSPEIHVRSTRGDHSILYSKKKKDKKPRESPNAKSKLSFLKPETVVGNCIVARERIDRMRGLSTDTPHQTESYQKEARSKNTFQKVKKLFSPNNVFRSPMTVFRSPNSVFRSPNSVFRSSNGEKPTHNEVHYSPQGQAYYSPQCQGRLSHTHSEHLSSTGKSEHLSHARPESGRNDKQSESPNVSQQEYMSEQRDRSLYVSMSPYDRNNFGCDRINLRDLDCLAMEEDLISGSLSMSASRVTMSCNSDRNSKKEKICTVDMSPLEGGHDGYHSALDYQSPAVHSRSSPVEYKSPLDHLNGWKDSMSQEQGARTNESSTTYTNDSPTRKSRKESYRNRGTPLRRTVHPASYITPGIHMSSMSGLTNISAAFLSPPSVRTTPSSNVKAAASSPTRMKNSNPIMHFLMSSRSNASHNASSTRADDVSHHHNASSVPVDESPTDSTRRMSEKMRKGPHYHMQISPENLSFQELYQR